MAYCAGEINSEEWRPVVGYEGWYEVSSVGRVRRLKAGRGARAGHILSHVVCRPGYVTVGLGKGTKASARVFCVHELVTRAFLGPCPAGHNVNHRDGDKTNPRLSNLEYVTYRENALHASRTGLRPTGSRHTHAKLTEEQAVEIRRAVLRGEYHHDIAEAFGISRPNVSDIARGRTWKHVPMLELTGTHMKHHRPSGLRKAEYQHRYTVPLTSDPTPPSP